MIWYNQLNKTELLPMGPNGKNKYLEQYKKDGVDKIIATKNGDDYSITEDQLDQVIISSYAAEGISKKKTDLTFDDYKKFSDNYSTGFFSSDKEPVRNLPAQTQQDNSWVANNLKDGVEHSLKVKMLTLRMEKAFSNGITPEAIYEITKGENISYNDIGSADADKKFKSFNVAIGGRYSKPATSQNLIDLMADKDFNEAREIYLNKHTDQVQSYNDLTDVLNNNTGMSMADLTVKANEINTKNKLADNTQQQQAGGGAEPQPHGGYGTAYQQNADTSNSIKELQLFLQDKKYDIGNFGADTTFGAYSAGATLKALQDGVFTNKTLKEEAVKLLNLKLDKDGNIDQTDPNYAKTVEAINNHDQNFFKTLRHGADFEGEAKNLAANFTKAGVNLDGSKGVLVYNKPDKSLVELA